jgi:hypothetical protein
MIFLYFPLDRCTSRIEAAKMLCEPYRVKFHFRNEPKKSDGSIEHAPHSLYKDPKSLISWGCSESWVEMYFQTMT